MSTVQVVDEATGAAATVTVPGRWRVTLSCAYPGEGWTDVDEQVVGTAQEAETLLREMAARVFAIDDARFDGPGTPVDHTLSLTYEEN